MHPTVKRYTYKWNNQCLLTMVTFMMLYTSRAMKYPGGTEPSKVEAEIGSTFNISCIVLTDANISSIWFTKEPLFNKSASISIKIEQPNNDITIINTTTAVLTIRNASESQSEYTCMSDKNAIGQTRVFIGTPPKPVDDFSCRSYDFAYMECSFTKSKNYLFTDYKLNFTNSYKKKQTNKICPLVENIDNKTIVCNITSNYLSIKEFYFFNLNISNKLGYMHQTFHVNNFKSMIPSIKNVTVKDVSYNNVTLMWELKNFNYYDKASLEYEINFIPQGGFKHSVVYNTCNASKCSVTIQNLQFPYHIYTVQIRAKIFTVENESISMWSKPFEISFQTDPKSPNISPAIAIGSYYIESETSLYLYWQHLADDEKNGPGFYYNVTEIFSNGTEIFIGTTTQSWINTSWNHDARDSEYHIKASNNYGQANTSASIRVYTISNTEKDDYLPQTISSVYQNYTYTLTWLPPNKLENLKNYTIFWCIAKKEQRNNCLGSVQFKYIDKHQRNFTADFADHQLNLAISANYLDYNTGMQWSFCLMDANSELTKPEIRESEIKRTDTSVTVYWLIYAVCSSIIEGYKLTYCEVMRNYTNKCIHFPHAIKINKTQKREYKIENLKPFTLYQFNISMFSKEKESPAASLLVETNESAPSAPQHLQFYKSSLTSNSVNLTWYPPKDKNGVIQHYTIISKIIFHNSSNQEKITSEDFNNVEQNGRISYTLRGLRSFTNYVVYITASTVAESIVSNNVTFLTLIGVPSKPQQLSSEGEEKGLIKWKEPENPSGRLDFYIVAQIAKNKNNPEDKIIKYFLVKDNIFKYDFSQCGIKYRVKIRAVNVANLTEFDNKTFCESKKSKHNKYTNPETTELLINNNQSKKHPIDDIQRVKRNISDSRMSKNVINLIPSTTNANPNNELLCNYGAKIENGEIFIQCANFDKDDGFRISAEYYEEIENDSKFNELRFFCSEWDDSLNIYECYIPTSLMIYVAIAILFVIVFGVWCRKKYIKMNNIEAVLPEGLAAHIQTSKKGNSITFTAYVPNIEKSSYKEDHYLLDTLTKYNNFSKKMFSSCLPENSEVDLDQQIEPASITSFEQNSQSTDSMELNDVVTPHVTKNDYYNIEKPNLDFVHCNLQMPTNSETCKSSASMQLLNLNSILEENPSSKMPQQPQSNGYVGLSSLALLSNQRIKASINNETIEEPPTGGYVTQQQLAELSTQQLKSNTNDYETLNAPQTGGYVTQQQLAVLGQFITK